MKSLGFQFNDMQMLCDNDFKVCDKSKKGKYVWQANEQNNKMMK